MAIVASVRAEGQLVSYLEAVSRLEGVSSLEDAMVVEPAPVNIFAATEGIPIADYIYCKCK